MNKLERLYGRSQSSHLKLDGTKTGRNVTGTTGSGAWLRVHRKRSATEREARVERRRSSAAAAAVAAKNDDGESVEDDEDGDGDGDERQRK